MMPNDDLIATSGQAQGPAIGYYLEEWDRRQAARLNRTIATLTWVLVALTGVVVVFTVVSTIAILSGS
jgi:hypothetical protein